MESEFVHFASGATILGGGASKPQSLKAALRLAPNLVAADGGARVAFEMGHSPLAVIGDLDSLDAQTRSRIDPARIYRIEEQDSTDFDKALRSVAAPLVIGVGFMGRRLDHELAAYNSLVRHPDRPCILLGAHDLCFLAPLDLQMDLPAGTRFSLFPMAPCRIRVSGLRWSFDGLDLAPDGRVGTSNEVAEGPVRLAVSARKLLVILPRECLEPAARALAPECVRAG